jgi:hypothetical protein
MSIDRWRKRSMMAFLKPRWRAVESEPISAIK